MATLCRDPKARAAKRRAQAAASSHQPTELERCPRVAWASSEQGRNNVLVAAAPDFQARQLTSFTEDDGQEISSLSLSADGEWAVFVRGGEHGGNWQRNYPANPSSLPRGTQVEIWSAPCSGGASGPRPARS